MTHLVLGALLLAISSSAGAQYPNPNRPPLADSTGESDVYPIGEAVGVYRAVLDLLYVDGDDRPSVIVLWDRAKRTEGGPCSWRCTEPWPHQSTIDTATILAFTQQSLKTPRIIDFGYRIPIVRLSEEMNEQLTHLGFGYLAHLPPQKVGGVNAHWEGFRRKYPGAWGRVVLSKVGFNPAHTEALVRAYQSCGEYCRVGETIVLRRAGKEWRVVERVVDALFESGRSSGALRYRGPAVTGSQRSQIVATAAADASPRTERDAAAKIPSPIVAHSRGVYSGAYTGAFHENNFTPCGVRGIGSGWAVRFKNPRDTAFLQYPHKRGGLPGVTHFIQVRGRVSAPGRFGIGFQAREIVIDSVLAVSHPPQPCLSYEDVAHPWPAIPAGSWGSGSAMSEDRSLAAVADADAIISIWDVERRTLVQRFAALDTGRLGFGGMAFSPDGNLLAAGGPDGVVRVWNARTGQRMWTLAGLDTASGRPGTAPAKLTRSEGLTFNDSGTLLANTILNQTVIWSMTSGERLGSYGYFWTPRFLFLGDSSFIASGDSGVIRIYPRLGAAPTDSIRLPIGQVELMRLSRDRRWLIAKDRRDVAYLWSLGDRRPGPRLTIPYWFGMGTIAFSPDGNIVALSGGAGGLYLWETATGRPLRSFQNFPGGVPSAWFTADGKSIVTWGSGTIGFRIVHLAADPGIEPVEMWPPSKLTLPRPPPHPRSISGFVTDARGKGVVVADVSLYDGDRPGSKPIARVRTNAAGHYLVQEVAPTHVTVQVDKRGFARAIKYVHVPTYWIPVDIKLRDAAR